MTVRFCLATSCFTLKSNFPSISGYLVFLHVSPASLSSLIVFTCSAMPSCTIYSRSSLVHFLHCSFTFKSVSGHSYICHYLTHFLQSEHLMRYCIFCNYFIFIRTIVPLFPQPFLPPLDVNFVELPF